MYIKLFQSDNKYLNLDIKELVKILKKSDKAYHDIGKPIITDTQYDLLKERLKELSPDNDYFKEIGYKPPEKLKIKLPYYLGSQNKLKYENIKELDRWFNKYNNPQEYYINEKLDGISCLIVNDKNNNLKIYTRGDGSYGIDISNIRKYIKTIPKIIPKNIAIRGELLLSKKNWENLKEYGVNPRNLVAGIINRKKIDEKILSLIDFVVYDYLSERMEIKNGLEYVSSLGFKIAKNILITHELTNSELLEILKTFKNNSEYEIDGIVITHNKKYNLIEGKNPDYSFAFKSNLLLNEAEVMVNDVEWNVSKDKYLKPIIKFNPVILNGVSIKQTTGFNADYIVKNKIGIGSIIKIQRSGDVIPHIIDIIKIADNNQPLMPSVPYIWNKSKIDILLDTDKKNREQDIKSFTYFMKSLKLKGISEGIITKLYDNSYDTLFKIINITKEELLNIEGFKEKSAINLINILSEIKNKSCNDIMIASNILGRNLGEKKIKLIINKFPYICHNKEKAFKLTIDDIKTINGMGDISSKQFIENLNNFYNFYDELNIKFNNNLTDNNEKNNNKIINKKNINKDIENKHFVFSGFRNDEFQKYIENNNGFIDNNIINKTNYLIVKDKEKITKKIEKAIEKNIIIISIEDFEKMIKK